MKRRMISLVLLMVMLVQCLPLLPAPASAADASVTLNFAGGSGTNLDPISFTDEASGISAVFTAGTHSTKPRWDAGCVRFYGTASVTNHLTISAPEGGKITSIVFTMNGSYKLTDVSADSGTIDTSSNTWTGSAPSVVFTTTAQTRFEGAKVTYTYEAAHKHEYVWNGESGADGSHTLTCKNTDGKCDALTTTEECTWVEGACSVCGAEAPECGHPTTTEVAEVPATCTEIGYTAGVQCTACQQYTSGHEEIPVLGHAKVTDEAVAATCTATGLTQGSHCSRCKEVFTAQTITDALGHNYVNGVCSVCNEKQPTKLIFDRKAFGDASGYDWHSWTAETTTQASFSGYGFIYGTTTGSIQMNGDKDGDYIYNTTPLPGKIVSVTIKKASGTDRNFDVLTSDTPFDYNTTASLKGQATAAAKKVTTEGATWTFTTDHKYFAIVIADSNAAYLSSIEIAYEVCGHTNKIAIGDAKAATCTEDGITAGEKCADCGEIITPQATIKALGHSYENGTCATCGKAQCTEHAWVGGEVITPATCKETGLQAQHCDNCGQPGENKVLDKLPHTPEIDAAEAATCTATGLTEGSHCSVCKEVLVAQQIVPMSDHTYVEGVCSACKDIYVAGDKLAEFQFGTDGGGTNESDTETSAGIIDTNGGYVLDFTTAQKVYAKSYDAKGNAVLKLGTAKVVGTFEFMVDSNVSTVVIYVAGRGDAAAKVTVNGTTHPITTRSNDGEYTKLVVDTTQTKTVSFTTVDETGGDKRAMVNAIEFWGESAIPDKLAGVTGDLGDSIGVNFYWNLTETTRADETAYVQLTLPNVSEPKKVYVKDIESYSGLYPATANIAVKEMTDVIKAQLVTARGNSREYTYTVRDYAMYIVNKPTIYSEAEVTLAKAMLNYGAYAQLMFNYNTGEPANSGLPAGDQALADAAIAETYKWVNEGSVTDTECSGATAVWEAATSIRYYFSGIAEGVTFALYDGSGNFLRDLTVTSENDNRWVAIDGIVAQDLGTTYILKVSKGDEEMTIKGSVYSYFYDVISGNFVEEDEAARAAAIAAAKAGYLYGEAARAYENSKQEGA